MRKKIFVVGYRGYIQRLKKMLRLERGLVCLGCVRVSGLCGFRVVVC